MEKPSKPFRLDAAGVRALAHPLRMRVLEALRAGPATATTLSRELGESTGATSYHLRSLERFGLVEEVEGRGRGRERWWRRPEHVRWLVGDETVESRAAGMSAMGSLLARDEHAFAGFVALESALDQEWRDAATVVSWHLTGTAEDVRELADKVAELVDDLRRKPQQHGGGKPVHVTFRVIPQPGDGA